MNLSKSQILSIILFTEEICRLLAANITCTSFASVGSGPFQTKKNITGPGNACCAVKAWAGNAFGIDYMPYDSYTQVCCKDPNKLFIGGILWQSSKIGTGNDCCNDVAFDNSTQICCSKYETTYMGYLSGIGEGDTCCGLKAYYKTKQDCCESYRVGFKIYTVADGCCGQNSYNKTYQICCNGLIEDDGDACCNKNGLENVNELRDVAYYRSKKCCKNGKLYNYACNKGLSLSFSFKVVLFYLMLSYLATITI